jgi:hypothetical protein
MFDVLEALHPGALPSVYLDGATAGPLANRRISVRFVSISAPAAGIRRRMTPIMAACRIAG